MSEEKPMTVGELIKKLQEFDPKLPVFLFDRDYEYMPFTGDIYSLNTDFIKPYNDDCYKLCASVDPDGLKACLIA